MTEAIIDDLTGKAINKKDSFQVQVLNRSLGIRKQFDCDFNGIHHLLRQTTAIEWYVLKKNKETGKWDQIGYSGDIPNLPEDSQQRID